MTETACAIRARGLRHAYHRGEAVLDLPALEVARGERVFVHGPSGCGKSTLLALVGGVLTVREGTLEVLGTPLHGASAATRDRLRADRMGIVFQLFNLIPYLSPLDNVLLPVRVSSLRRRACGGASGARERAMALLGELGLGPVVEARDVSRLSVGQQQRVALARALIGNPELIVCDEPTSALDAGSRDAFLEVLARQLDASGATLLFVSHDHALSGHFARVVDLAAENRAAAASVAA